MDSFAEIQVSELGIKTRSKKEVYNLLWNEGDVYLSPIEDAYHRFISQILVGDKRYLKCSQIKVCSVPQWKGHLVEHLTSFAKEHIDIKAYLPDYEYHKLPNRQWLWNLLNTLIGDKFKAHIKATTKERTKYVINKRKMSVKALPEFISIFWKSDCVSVQNGKTHYLLKAAGRRKWNQMEDDNRDRLMKAKDEAMILNETINSLQQKIEYYRNRDAEYLENKEKLVKLYQQDIIDSDGELKE